MEIKSKDVVCFIPATLQNWEGDLTASIKFGQDSNISSFLFLPMPHNI